MGTTRIRLLIVLAAIAAVLGYAVVTIVVGQSGRVIQVPWLAAATLWLFALALLLWTLLSRPRLRRRPGAKPMPPLMAARSAALAMAASRAGALVAGFYAGVALASLPHRDTPAGLATSWSSAACALGAVALAAASLWLEYLCRLPLDDDRATAA
jgi:Kef-type K+ transport system membrane component KefB